MASKMNFDFTNGGGGSPELRNSTISVWWDYENCEVPKSGDASLIVNNITAALKKLDLCGPIIFSAYGDVKKIPVDVLEAINCTGITMINVPPGENATDFRMILDVSLWAVHNPAPATYILISGDKDFFYTMDQLGKLGYTIIIARPENCFSSQLVSAAKHVWCWTDLCKKSSSAVEYTPTKSFGTPEKRIRKKEG